MRGGLWWEWSYMRGWSLMGVVLYKGGYCIKSYLSFMLSTMLYNYFWSWFYIFFIFLLHKFMKSTTWYHTSLFIIRSCLAFCPPVIVYTSMSISDSLSSLDSSSNSLSKQINYIYKMSYHQINTTFYQDWFVKKNISSKSTVGQKDFFLPHHIQKFYGVFSYELNQRIISVYQYTVAICYNPRLENLSTVIL